MKTKILVLGSVLSFNIFAIETSSIAVKDREIFWQVNCHPTKGVQGYDRENNLRKVTGLDAFGANLSYSSYDHKSDKFTVRGVVYGYKCEKQEVANGKKEFKWKIVSLKDNKNVRPRISSVKYGLFSSNFALKLNHDFKFQLETTSKEFLGSLRSSELKNKKDIGTAQFQIVFDVIDTRNSIDKIRLQSPFFSYKYDLKDLGEESQLNIVKE